MTIMKNSKAITLIRPVVMVMMVLLTLLVLLLRRRFVSKIHSTVGNIKTKYCSLKIIFAWTN